MCSENEPSCNYDQLIQAKIPEQICGQLALLAAGPLLESGTVTYQEPNPDPQEVLYVAVNSGNKKVEAYTAGLVKQLSNVAVAARVTNPSLAMSA